MFSNKLVIPIPTLKRLITKTLKISYYYFCHQFLAVFIASSFATAPSSTCSYHFSVCSNKFFLQRSQWKGLKGPKGLVLSLIFFRSQFLTSTVVGNGPFYNNSQNI